MVGGGRRKMTIRNAVNGYLKVSGASRPSIDGEETILSQKKAANRLAIDCIYALSKGGNIQGDLSLNPFSHTNTNLV